MKQNKYSDYKILHFEEKMNSFLKAEITAPIYVRIKPINLCNHGCFFCVYSTGFRVKDSKDKIDHIISGMHQNMSEKDFIPYEKMQEIISNLNLMGVKAVTYSGGGEPLIYKHIVSAMEMTLSKNIDLSIITNGQRLDKDRAEVLTNAKWVRVSMDYTSQEQMKEFRNVPFNYFDQVINNLKNFSRRKKANCELAVNYIIHDKNYKNLYEFVKILKDCGVENVRLSPMWTPNFYEYHKKISNEVEKEMSKIQNLIDASFTVNTTYNIVPNSSHSIHRVYNKCFIMQTVPVIGADLNVYACHNKAYDDSGLIGSIKDKTFKELWFSEATKKFMQDFNPRRKCLHECSNDKKNILINEVLDSNFDNFV